MDNIFPVLPDLSEEEKIIVGSAFAHPAVKKHLRNLAESAVRQHYLATMQHNLNIKLMAADEISVRFAGLTGQLTLIESLVSFQLAKSSSTS